MISVGIDMSKEKNTVYVIKPYVITVSDTKHNSCSEKPLIAKVYEVSVVKSARH